MKNSMSDWLVMGFDMLSTLFGAGLPRRSCQGSSFEGFGPRPRALDSYFLRSVVCVPAARLPRSTTARELTGCRAIVLHSRKLRLRGTGAAPIKFSRTSHRLLMDSELAGRVLAPGQHQNAGLRSRCIIAISARPIRGRAAAA